MNARSFPRGASSIKMTPDDRREAAEMSASSGEKRRRKRERQFLHFYDTMSLRATVAGVGGGIVLLIWIAARSVLAG